MLAKPREVDQQQKTDRGEQPQQQSSRQSESALAKRQPTRRGPEREGDDQEETLESRQRRQTRRHPGQHQDARADLRDSSPQEIHRQHHEQPERRVADDLGTPLNELGVHRVENAGEHRHAIIKHPTRPAEQREHDEARHRDAPPFARRLPVHPQLVHARQSERKRVETKLQKALLPVPLLQGPRPLDIQGAVGANRLDPLGQHCTRNETQRDQPQQQPGPPCDAAALRRRLGESVGIVGQVQPRHSDWFHHGGFESLDGEKKGGDGRMGNVR